MKNIETKFGTISIDDYEYNNNIREDKDRIKIFDSKGEYLDYLSVELVEEGAELDHVSPQQAIDSHAKYLAEAKTIEDLCSRLDIVPLFITTNVDEMVEKLKAMEYEDIDPYNNEFVNIIGDYLILVDQF